MFDERESEKVPTIDHHWSFLHLGTTGFVRTIYSSVLTNTSAPFCRSGACVVGVYYYEALKFTVSTAGNYTIRSNSTLDTYGYLYNNTFYSNFPSLNKLQENDDGAGANQFLLSMYLQTMTDYILVSTTFGLSISGAFTIIVQGPATVNLSLTNSTGQCWHDIPQWLWLIDSFWQESDQLMFFHSSLHS